MENRIKNIPWWIIVMSLNLIFIIASVINNNIYNFPGKQLMFNPLNLAYEMNLATWWSTSLLIFPGLIAYELFSVKTDKTKYAWLSLSIILLALSLDEVGSIHERVGNWLPYILLGSIFISYSLIVLYKSPKTRMTSLLILAGFTLYGSVAIQEIVEHNLQWPAWFLGIRLGIEEGVELMGSSLCLFALILQKGDNLKTPLSRIFPSLFRMRLLPELIFILLFIHIIISVIVDLYIEISYKGNPVVWYPAFLFFILFLGLYDQGIKWKKGGLLSYLPPIFFLIASVSTVYIISPRTNESKFHLLGLLSNFYFLFFMHLIISSALFLLVQKSFTKKNLFIVVTLALVLLFGFLSEGLLAQYIISGIYTFLIARLFLVDLATSERKTLKWLGFG